MTDTSAEAFLALVGGRAGHFRLESGHHSALWLDLDTLFAEPARVAPYVDALARNLRKRDAALICGPLLGGAFLAQLLAHTLDLEFAFTERVLPAHDRGLYGVGYRLPAALGPLVRGKRVAIVDDVMSAGSALRGTFAELLRHGALPVVAGTLLVLGTAGEEYFAGEGVPVDAVARRDYRLWIPEACPLCAARQPLEDVVALAGSASR
ncbi:MAG TPA: phosphoribosyltransferase family protein [Gemmatimonadaceae bacterium]|nr:phosphoribosyltransferase family protein [Gemmatimonadaceae bacterium]